MTSFLILAACGNSEESKSEDKKETKSSSKDDKKKDENKKPKDDKKDKEETDKKETSNTDNAQQNDTEQANTEQQTQSVEQSQSTQEPVQSQEQAQPVEQQQQPVQQEPTKEEIAEWDRQNISGGTDAGLLDSDAAYKQMKEEEEADLAAQEAKEEKLHDEYNALTEQMYGEDSNLSDEEIEKLEEKQDAILDQVEPIN